MPTDFPTAYDVSTRLPVDLQGDALDQAIATGTHSFEKGASVPVLGPDGQPYFIPADKAREALAQGFKTESPEAQEQRLYLKENEGVAGSLKVGGAKLASEALLGVPELVYENMADPKEVRKWEALKEEHKVASVVGSVAGIAASTVVGGELFKAGELAGKGAEAGVRGLMAGEEALDAAKLTATAADIAGEASTKAAGSYTRQEAIRGLATKVIGGAVQGAVTSAPAATAELFTGDPQRAAEMLATGTILGGSLGMLGLLWSPAIQDTQQGIKKALEAATEHSEAVSTAAGWTAKGLTKVAVAKTVGGMLHEVPGAGAFALFGEHSLSDRANKWVKTLVKNWLDSDAPQVAGRRLDELSKRPIESGLGSILGIQAESVLGQHLARIPGIVGEINADQLGRVGRERAVRKDFERDSRQITDLASNPSKLLDFTSGLASVISHDEPTQQVANALQGQLINTVGYLNQSLPKPATLPGPFQKQTWQPNEQQLRSFYDRLDIAQDPLSSLKKLQDGTLSADHMDALRNLYPKTYQSIQQAVLETASLPTAPVLPYVARVRLSRLLGIPLDPSLTPERLRSLQGGTGGAQAESASEATVRGGRVPSNLPSSSTQLQRVAVGQVGKAK